MSTRPTSTPRSPTRASRTSEDLCGLPYRPDPAAPAMERPASRCPVTKTHYVNRAACGCRAASELRQPTATKPPLPIGKGNSRTCERNVPSPGAGRGPAPGANRAAAAAGRFPDLRRLVIPDRPPPAPLPRRAARKWTFWRSRPSSKNPASVFRTCRSGTNNNVPTCANLTDVTSDHPAESSHNVLRNAANTVHDASTHRP